MGIYAGALGFSSTPKCSERRSSPRRNAGPILIKPEHKGEVQNGKPRSFGHGLRGARHTRVQIYGEDKAFDYLKQLHRNISNYPKSGTGPVKAAARGETAIGVSFMHDVPGEKKNGFPG